MVIQIDSREKDRAIRKIVEEFDRQGVKHPVSKLMVGDYMNYDNPRLTLTFCPTCTCSRLNSLITPVT